MSLLADDFFRLAHSDVRGEPLLHPVALSTGLAAGLLGELVCTGHLGIQAGRVFPRPGRPDGSVSARVLELLRGEDHPLRTWLEYLAGGSVFEVSNRLTSAGHLRVHRSRRMLRQRVTYLPTNQLEAARPMAVLATRLQHRLALEPAYGHLAGLMVATGLHTRVLAGAPPESHVFMRELIARSAGPAMLELFAHTESVIGAAVLVHRT